MQTYWLNLLYQYWDEKDTPYSDYYDFWTDQLYQYFNELPLGEANESAYITQKSEQHKLTPKYEILRSLVTLVKNLFCDYGGG